MEGYKEEDSFFKEVKIEKNEDRLKPYQDNETKNSRKPSDNFGLAKDSDFLHNLDKDI